MPQPRRSRLSLALAPLLALAACQDGPTGPDSYVQSAGGVEWVAVTEPVGMARADAWLRYAAPDAPVRAAVHGLHESAARSRAAGRMEEALRMEGQALLLAAGGMSRSPAPRRVLEPLAALDVWADRARERLEQGRYPALDSALTSVAARADSARAALAAGDTSAAVLLVARGTLRAREQGPMAVGLRLLASAEARLQARGAGQNAARARRLLAGAREGLAAGDSIRALRRAVYALQLLDAPEAPGQMVDSADAPR
ncbi:MAG TPA: hypothetical protein VF665_06325 [Longimicrobium sp.]|jgi:hypothetical protein|uniref:hypothetical protein n=1 Tax=Longimicrobium sp. TaxID=2029185 RepID=UPI002EDB29D6